MSDAGMKDEGTRTGATPDTHPEGGEVREDEARKLVLARRARFIAVALAGAGLANACDSASPEACLRYAGSYDAGTPPTPPEPQACLSPALLDAGVSPPQVCLIIALDGGPTPVPDAAADDAGDDDGG